MNSKLDQRMFIATNYGLWENFKRFSFFFGWEKQKLPFSLKEKVNFSRALKNKPNGTTEIG